MNMIETRTFLTQLWSAFPSAPRMTNEEKHATVMVWCVVLQKFSFRDVWTAAEKVLEKNPKFVPSAFEIKSQCVETPDVESFLPSKYHELDKSRKGYTSIFSDIPYSENMYLSAMLERETDPEKVETFKSAIAQNEREHEIENEMHRIYEKAKQEAIEKYRMTERNKFIKDGAKFGISETNFRLENGLC